MEQEILLRTAIEALLDDPTQDNLFVLPIDDTPPYRPGDFGMVWGELTLVFRFLNPLVVEVFDLWPREPG